MSEIVAVKLLAGKYWEYVSATDSRELRASNFGEIWAELAEEDVIRRKHELVAGEITDVYRLNIQKHSTALNMFQTDV